MLDLTRGDRSDYQLQGSFGRQSLWCLCNWGWDTRELLSNLEEDNTDILLPGDETSQRTESLPLIIATENNWLGNASLKVYSLYGKQNQGEWKQDNNWKFQLCFEDLWRRKNPDISGFIHYDRSSDTRSRIDRVYNDKKIANNTKINHKMISFSDHYNALFIDRFSFKTKIGKDMAF